MKRYQEQNNQIARDTVVAHKHLHRIDSYGRERATKNLDAQYSERLSSRVSILPAMVVEPPVDSSSSDVDISPAGRKPAEALRDLRSRLFGYHSRNVFKIDQIPSPIIVVWLDVQERGSRFQGGWAKAGDKCLRLL